MKTRTSVKKLLTFALALAGTWASAGIVYDEAINCIIVDDYPENIPCDLREIHIADKMNGWGKVEYDKTADVYTIDAGLVIGQDNGTDTYMFIGTAENPNESLLLKGHLVVHPFVILGDKQSRQRRINRLTIGNERDTGARPSLKLAGKGIFVGCVPSGNGKKKRRGAGGDLRLYNCLVSGAGDVQSGQAAGPCDLSAWRCSFTAVNTAFRNFHAAPITGIHTYMNDKIENCVFSDCGSGFANVSASRVLKLPGCAFKNFKAPVFASSPRIELADAEFENNAMNWDLSRGGYVLCVDCFIGAAAKASVYGTGANPRTKKDERAFFADMRHVIVQVLDKAGTPVAGAKVVVRAEEAGEGTSQDHAITSTDGLTPGKGEGTALLLTKTRTESDGKDGASTTGYSYSITATHKDQTGAVKGFKPSASWETVSVTID